MTRRFYFLWLNKQTFLLPNYTDKQCFSEGGASVTLRYLPVHYGWRVCTARWTRPEGVADRRSPAGRAMERRCAAGQRDTAGRRWAAESKKTTQARLVKCNATQ